jgi:polysaccharide export outer membrane protein
MRLTFVLFSAVLGLLIPCFPQSPAGSTIGVAGSYKVGPGDVLDIAVFEVEELSKTAAVGAAGRISLPMLGDVPVAGLTTRSIETDLERRYAVKYLNDPQISVSVKEFRSQPVSLIGAVDKPGVYQLQGSRRLIEVLAMAGGFAPDVGDVITISRRGEDAGETPDFLTANLPESQANDLGVEPEPASGAGSEIEVSVRELLRMSGGHAHNPLIEPHYVIRVSKAGLIYVMGAVEKPGGFPIKDQETLTVLRAVSLALGTARHASPQKARLIRGVDGAKQEIPVRIQDMVEGKLPDIAMRADDILFIPDSRAKSALGRGAEAALQIATGIAIWGR